MPVYKRTYQRKSKPDRTVWCYQFQVDGVRYNDCGYDTQKKAKDAEAQRRRKLNSKRNRPIAYSDATLEQFLPAFLDHRRVTRATNTVNRESRGATPLIKVFGNCRLLEISPKSIHDYVATRITKDCVANRTVNLELSLLRSIYGYAMACDMVDESPVKGVRNLTEVRDEHWIPSMDELERFINAAKTSPTATVFVPWLWFRAYTGTRPTESVYVEWHDIDFERELIHLRPKAGHDLKNGKFRVVEMHDDLKPILLAWRDEWLAIFNRWGKRHPKRQSPPHDWVFFNPRRVAYRAISFTKSFEYAKREAGLPQMTSHTLRHYFISYCVMSGVDFFTIAKWVGHKNTKMIEETYGHLSPQYCRKQMSKVEILSGHSDLRATA